jgi:hypothetical protein
MHLPRNYFDFLMLTTLILSVPVGRAQASNGNLPVAPAGWELIWHDEFDQPGLPNSALWSYDVGGDGWGNREAQFYTSGRLENARVEQGHLIIEARREQWQKAAYTSARLVSKNKGDWSAGRFEIRAQVPLGRGTWAAVWMLPTVWNLGNGAWPDNGEIDILEHVGHEPAGVRDIGPQASVLKQRLQPHVCALDNLVAVVHSGRCPKMCSKPGAIKASRR